MNSSHIKLSDNLVVEIRKLSAGFLTNSELDSILLILEKEISKNHFSISSEANFIRILHALYNPISFLKDVLKFPHIFEILITICSYSNYLSEILIRNPEYLFWLIDEGMINKKFDEEKFGAALESKLSSYNNFDSKLNYLKSIKRREILRIGSRDLLSFSELIETTTELSFLARTISKNLFNICYETILKKYKLEKINRNYALVSLGKMGGDELNYSSDIDLIIFFDKYSKLKNGKEYFEILTEAVQLFIKSASNPTETGFLYRVDFRLRPDGKTSPLCRSINSYFSYYEARGADWERQMLLKSNFISGDKNLYHQFKKYLIPFIFPSSFSISPLEQIQKMKNKIELHSSDEMNIKTSKGGIRNIEFSVQALQLLNGGKIEELRTQNTLDALNKLQKNNLLRLQEYNLLTECYCFYRKIEHFLQLMNDKQTHTIPKDEEMLEKLSFYLGYKSTQVFLNDLSDKKKKIEKFFIALTSSSSETKKIKLTFRDVKFLNQAEAKKHFNFLMEGKGLEEKKEFDSMVISSFQKIEKHFLELLHNANHPDLALSNIYKVIAQEKFPSIWFELFQNKKILISFFYIAENFNSIIDELIEDSLCREFFLSGKYLDEEASQNNYSIKHTQFLLKLKLVLKIIDQRTVSKKMTGIIQKKINDTTEDYAKINFVKHKFFVAGMGSVSNDEMDFSSDVDLIFVIDDSSNKKNLEEYFQILLSRIKIAISPINIDCRLRPEGKSSTLVWDLNGYKNYLQSRIRVWELQAFCRIKILYGDENLFKEFMDNFSERIESSEIEVVQKEIRNIILQLNSSVGINQFDVKKSVGGLNDILFLTEFFMVTNSKIFRECFGKETDEILRYLSRKKIIQKRESDLLIHNFRILKIYKMIATLGNKNSIESIFLKLMNIKNINDKLAEVKKSNREIFNKYLKTQ